MVSPVGGKVPSSVPVKDASGASGVKEASRGLTLGPRADFKNPKVAAYLNDPAFRSLPFNFSDKDFTYLSGEDMSRILDVPIVKQDPGAFVREIMVGPSGVQVVAGVDAYIEVARTLGRVGDSESYELLYQQLDRTDGKRTAQRYMDDAFKRARPDFFEEEDTSRFEPHLNSPEDHAALVGVSKPLWD